MFLIECVVEKMMFCQELLHDFDGSICATTVNRMLRAELRNPRSPARQGRGVAEGTAIEHRFERAAGQLLQGRVARLRCHLPGERLASVHQSSARTRQDGATF